MRDVLTELQGKLKTLISIEHHRQRLAGTESLPQLAVLSVAIGVVAALVVLLFVMLIKLGTQFVIGVGPERFEDLNALWRFVVPVAGATIVGLALTRLSDQDRRVGTVHVMEQLGLHHGYMPRRNFAVQFFGGVGSLVSGVSGGREGPAIHLGAAAASWLAQRLRMPHNSVRTLTACGIAAAIAASFNTPIAGVILTMEVVVMEYTIASFLPVILSSFTATAIMRLLLGDAALFSPIGIELTDLGTIPNIILMGICLGLVATAFNYLVEFFSKQKFGSFWMRASLAGVVTGVAAIFIPEAMGMGYDTVDAALSGAVTWSLIFTVAFLVAKIIATAASVGLGLPVGLIGPTVVMGAAFGLLAGNLSNPDPDGNPAHTVFYVLLGMAGMMAAVLHAPLAALMAILELTGNSGIIFPAMLVIAAATITTSGLFGRRSIFLARLNALGVTYPLPPSTQVLLRHGVESFVSSDYEIINDQTDKVATLRRIDMARHRSGRLPHWLVVWNSEASELRLVDSSQLIEELEQSKSMVFQLNNMNVSQPTLHSCDRRATLDDAMLVMDREQTDVVCVLRNPDSPIMDIVGLLFREEIEQVAESDAHGESN